MRAYRSASLALLMLLLAGCDSDSAALAPGRPCDTATPCPLGRVCVDGFCQANPDLDASGLDTSSPTDLAEGRDWTGSEDTSTNLDIATADVAMAADTGGARDLVSPTDLPGAADLVSAPDVPGSADTGGTTAACRALSECEEGEICDLALGRCETRYDTPGLGLGVTSFHPPAGAAGDVIVVDGSGFYTSILGSLSVRLGVGSASMGGLASLWADENRVLGTLPGGASGTVKITAEGGDTQTAPGDFTTTATGVLACDGSTPAASGEAGAAPDALGPYAAGYVDWARKDARIYYPAECGSVRRPPVTGTHPLVFILHGNGAIHVNYEYLAQILASWGFVSVMPLTVNNNQYDPDVVAHIQGLVDEVRGQELSGVHGVLTGVSASNEIAFVGHSRGCGRMQDVYDDVSAIRQAAVASIFLGPHDVNYVCPGLFLVIGATEDGQSYPSIYNASYDRQSAPRWKVVIDGGNHSLFTDHKVYHAMDGTPSISRREQQRIVVQFALPLLQRAFGLDEPFAAQLDTPPGSSDYTVTYEL